MEVTVDNQYVKVHFLGWHHRYDRRLPVKKEWIRAASPDILAVTVVGHRAMAVSFSGGIIMWIWLRPSLSAPTQQPQAVNPNNPTRGITTK